MMVAQGPQTSQEVVPEPLEDVANEGSLFPQVRFDDGPPLSCLPRSLSLAACTFLGCFVGLLGGWACSEAHGCNEDWHKVVGFPGDLWVRALRLLVLPLMTTIMIMVPNHTKQVGQLGAAAFGFYVFTSSIAAAEGLMWGHLIKPGAGVTFAASQKSLPTNDLSVLDTILGIGFQAVPTNIVSASADLQVLGLIVVFGAFGVALRQVGKEQRVAVMNVAGALLHCTMLGVTVLAKFTPIGMASRVFSAVAGTENVLDVFRALGLYGITAVLGQLVHASIFYAFVYTCGMAIAKRKHANVTFFAGVVEYHPFSRHGFYNYVWKVKQALLTALATSSSAATLPVTLQAAQAAGVSQEVGNFVLPLGAAVNLDGTSLGFPIMTLFGAQLFNYQIPVARQIAVMLVSMVCSIGTAPIPNAGIVYLVLILTTAGGPLAQADVQGTIIGLILVLDWLVDRVETCSNVLSDCVVARVLDATKKGPNKDKPDREEPNTPIAIAVEV